MAHEENNTEVKEFIETVEVTPSTDTELIDDEEIETQEESSPQETEPEVEKSEGDAEPLKKETPVEAEEAAATEEVEATTGDEIKPVEGETLRERALRLETTRLRKLLRKEQSDELLGGHKKTAETVIPEDDELKQYDPEELKRFDTLAKKMGFVKKDELDHQAAQTQMDSAFGEFMEAHPEYLPENDVDGLLWGQFKSEFGLYNKPNDPKVLKKVLAKVHNEVAGIQPTANLSKTNAQREKVKIASHAGASTGKETKTSVSKPITKTALRTDAVKGFTDDEMKEIFG